ncbi:T9SS type A sorting domain-containing protein [Hymenobacter negativus]|uniref:T9SS type A sorting domain-containing protein n=1 Tax=Hymenobacter negativus TaxID=2795026 RepID=A0ABS3QLX4_9BACT|nr:T9SS type A sorting domain-containing protein [Hymenobacter negativus]MBO2011680.1 T9SS type A sorting domain-containing protein [Hymenobacter negativus]
MKQFFLSFSVLLACSTHGQAQSTVVNGDFESWRTNGAGVEVPQHWLNTEEFIAGLSGVTLPPTNTVVKTTDSHGGTYAVKVQTGPMGATAVAGVLVWGTAVVPGSPALGGKPFTARPNSMEFYYKTAGTAVADDSASITVTLTSRASGAFEIVGGGNTYISQPSATYALGAIPLTYQSTSVPDSAHIVITSGTGRSITMGTAVYLDDITMVTSPTATQTARKLDALTSFPNPSATGLFTLQAGQEPLLFSSALTVTDLTGRVVLRQPASKVTGQEKRMVDLRGQPAGVYTLRLLSADGTAVRTLVVQ